MTRLEDTDEDGSDYAERDSVLDIEIPYDAGEEWCMDITRRFGLGRLEAVIQARRIHFWEEEESAPHWKEKEKKTMYITKLTADDSNETVPVEGVFLGLRMIPVFTNPQTYDMIPQPFAVLLEAFNQNTNEVLCYEGQQIFVPLEDAGGAIKCFLKEEAI